MSHLRRRLGSESESQPLILVDSSQGKTSSFSQSRSENVPAFQSLGLSPTLKPNMSRDRTQEFATAIRSLQGKHIVRAVAAQDPNRAKNLQTYGEFMMLARTIGKNISSTYSKLEKLTLLAKRKSLFNDQPTEIQELTYIIKEDLSSLNGQIARLQEVTKHQNEVRNKSKTQHLQSHSSNVVIALQSKLASMSSQFKHVLEVRTENMKEAKKRREQFSQAPMAANIPNSNFSGKMQGSLLMAQDDSVTIDLSQASGGMMQQQRQQQMQIVPYDETDQYVTARAETMSHIESTIVELGGIFQQLAHMVKEQEEMVDRIDANIQDTELNVEAAHREILKYFQSVTSNRWLMIKIFGVLIFFFMFFLVFMA
uniref:t-SNARE coiled-coil homology domain-containing protein n=2 Tax=Lygus hesperus TaxID=30085 RepID=A0A0K8STS9_LYGHE